jgi:hypothetical protein
MCTLTNFYRLLESCLIEGIALDEDHEHKTVNFDLYEFINDCNDEIYHAQAYTLRFSMEHYKNLFSRRDLSPPLVKILVLSCESKDREFVESIIGGEVNDVTGYIKLQMDDGASVELDLNELDSYEEKYVQVYDIEYFLNNVDEKISVNNHWITAIFIDPESNEKILTDEGFLKKYELNFV